MRVTHEMFAILAAVVIAGGGHWLADGKPSGIPAIEMEQTPLAEGEIALETLQNEGREGVLFVDARRESEWRSDGLPGSIHLTTLSDQPLADQLIPHFEELLQARRIVVYCGDIHCGLSHELAEALKTYPDLLGGEVSVLHGGVVALKQAGWIKETNPGS
ncbi:rhodanese-related sulfurtransferase [Haloferula luteola]|uniref:Rhodanese-related sulfurtransferase n=1 Tax=Haloferula luteola TaxID=595692 RepID=A0A840V5K6_9BACT|nr:rhodanese-like domain-containing protein [Haloferula luteola]MBB5353527.1 rhodanese-related sulfurtransferase [Haloferula luteola]